MWTMIGGWVASAFGWVFGARDAKPVLDGFGSLTTHLNAVLEKQGARITTLENKLDECDQKHDACEEKHAILERKYDALSTAHDSIAVTTQKLAAGQKQIEQKTQALQEVAVENREAINVLASNQANGSNGK